MDLQLLDFYQISHATDYRKFQGKCIAITGATGFIGGCLTRYFMFLNDKYNMGIFLYLSVRNVEKALKIFGNREDIFFIYKHSFDFPADYIFHCASNATPIKNETDISGVIDTNITMTKRLLEVATDKCAKMMFLSAGEIYGPNNVAKLYEDNYYGIDPTISRNNYGLSKLMGENLCYNYYKKKGTRAYVARLFHTYGIGISLDDPRIFGTIVRHMVNEQPIRLKSIGAIRAFCYISDALIGLFTILDKGIMGEPYNVGGAAMSIEELTKTVAAYYNVEVTTNADVVDGSCYVPNCFKLKQLGWTPEVDIIDGFKHTIDHYKEHK